MSDDANKAALKSDPAIVPGTTLSSVNRFSVVRTYNGPETGAPDHSEKPASPPPEPAPAENAGITGEPGGTPAESAPPAKREASSAEGTSPPAGGEPAAKETPPEGNEHKKQRFRHKTHEAAEKSYSLLQAKTTKLEEEKLRMEQETARLKKQIEEKEAAEAAKIRETEEAKQRDAFYNTRYQQAMEDLQALDEDDPDYKTKAAAVWASAQSDIAAFVPEEIIQVSSLVTPPPKPADTAAAAEEPAAVTPPSGGMDTAPEADIPDDQVPQHISARLTEQKTEFAIDDPVFYGFCVQSKPVAEDGVTPLTLDEQIDWAIAQTRAHYDRERSKILQTAGQPLERGASAGSRPAGKEPPPDNTPKTLNDAISAAVEKRRLV